MVFLQAATNEAGPAFACFQLVEAGRLTLCLSADVLKDLLVLAADPSFRAQAPNLMVIDPASLLREVRPANEGS
jgi:hypothetical protein